MLLEAPPIRAGTGPGWDCLWLGSWQSWRTRQSWRTEQAGERRAVLEWQARVGKAELSAAEQGEVSPVPLGLQGWDGRRVPEVLVERPAAAVVGRQGKRRTVVGAGFGNPVRVCAAGAAV